MSKVAIIMRSKNEQPYAEMALKALQKQSYQDFTLYNVDSGSTDGTLEAILKENPQHVVQISPEKYVPGKVLNRMIKDTKEPFIVLLNADAIPHNHQWLENLLRPLFLDECDAAMSKQIPRKDAYFIVAYDYSRAYSQRHTEKNPFFFSAVSCAFKRELWEQTKFYEKGISEDLRWSKECQGKGARFQFVPSSVVEHSHNYTLKQWYWRKYGEGKAEVEIFNRKPNILRETYNLMKEIFRDLFYAIRKGKIVTIPYNIAYRFTAHLGMYNGSLHS